MSDLSEIRWLVLGLRWLAVAMWASSCAPMGSGSGDREALPAALRQPVDWLNLNPEAPDTVQSKSVDRVSANARLLTDAEALDRYGVDLAGKGIQAIWMRIHNGTAGDQWMLAAHLDPDFYTADEAAYLFRHRWAGVGHGGLRQRFRDLTMRARIGPGETCEGHVLVPRHEGGRFVEITLSGTGKVRRFGFPLRTADGHFDFESMDVAGIHRRNKPVDLSRSQMRAALPRVPAVATDKSGKGSGDPLNLVIVGEASTMMAAMSECGWAFTHRLDGTTVRRMISAALHGNPYLTAPVSSLYLFGRKQDVAFQRARSNLSQRNHMRLWLAPFTLEGRPVWIGQVSRDIGIRLTTQSPTLTTHKIDPMVDESRQFVLESLLFRFRIRDFGFTRAAPPAPPDQPRRNLTGDEYFTDGLRLVVVLSESAVPAENVRNLGWEQTVKGPVEFGQKTSPAGTEP